ncbi:MAG: hypothetical protein GX493_00955 [Firmicutes bacterium]|nr:hypothetical protein [Bacillota bacterium]
MDPRHYLCRPADFVIMDGLQGIQNGPTPSFALTGTDNIEKAQMNMGLILAGRDAVASGYHRGPPHGLGPRIRQLPPLSQSGWLGNLDVACIEVVGKDVPEVRKTVL